MSVKHIVRNILYAAISRYRSEQDTKIVSELSEEIHTSSQNQDIPHRISCLSAEAEQALSILTRARVEKHINKMADEGIIPYEWDSSHMEIITKILLERIYEDCLKEEPEAVKRINDFGAIAPKIISVHVKWIILEKNY